MEHPLARVIDRIDPAALYRVPDLADLLGLARSSTWALVQSGWFPGVEYEPVPDGTGRRQVWTGAALIAAADTDPPALDHTKYAPSTLWRLGCGCDDCLAWHNADSRDRHRRASDDAFPEQRRRRVLELVASGTVTVKEAAAQAEVTVGQVYGYARRDQEFERLLDEAAASLCRDPGGSRCATPGAYRAGCRGTACRRAHTPTTRRPAQA